MSPPHEEWKKQWMDYFGPHGRIRMCLVVKAPGRLESHHVSFTKVWTHRNWFYVLSVAIVMAETAVNMTCSVFQQYIRQRRLHLQVLFPEKKRDRWMDGGMATLVSCSCCVCCVKSAFFYWKRIALRFYCLHITLKLRFILRENRCGSASHYCDWFFGRQARGCARSITRSPCSLLTLSQRVKNNHPRFSPAARQRRLILFWVSISFPDFNRL